MPKLGHAKFEKVIVRLFEGDRDALAEAYPHVGYNAVIRTLVRKHLAKIAERTSRRISNEQSPLPELELDGEPVLLDE